jgi:hypothetical protein
MSKQAKRMLIGAILGVVLFLYFSGSLDTTLAGVGLNFHPCVKNGYGATFCGQDATNYCNELNASGINSVNQNSANVCASIEHH